MQKKPDHDNKTFYKIPALLILLFLLGAWNSISEKNSQLSLEDCLKSPAEHHLQILKLPLDTRIISIEEPSIRISSRGSSIEARFSSGTGSQDLKAGDFISMLAVFNKNGYIQVIKYRIHKLRKLKVYSSLITVFVFALVFLLNFRFNTRKLVFELR